MKSSIIFDFNRTLYAPEIQALMPCALFVLQELHARGHILYLVSREENNREYLIKELGIEKYFSGIAFFSEKTRGAFAGFMEKNFMDASKTFVVGDRVHEEIAIGNSLGMQTIWFQNGKFANELPRANKEEPTFYITNLEKILSIVL